MRYVKMILHKACYPGVTCSWLCGLTSLKRVTWEVIWKFTLGYWRIQGCVGSWLLALGCGATGVDGCKHGADEAWSWTALHSPLEAYQEHRWEPMGAQRRRKILLTDKLEGNDVAQQHENGKKERGRQYLPQRAPMCGWLEWKSQTRSINTYYK